MKIRNEDFINWGITASIYALVKDGKPFYVGSTEYTLEERFQSHQHLAPGVSIELLALVSNDHDRYNHENRWMELLRREGHELINKTKAKTPSYLKTGKSGNDLTPETKPKSRKRSISAREGAREAKERRKAL